MHNKHHFSYWNGINLIDAQIAPDEAWLSFDQEAFVLHNKVETFRFGQLVYNHEHKKKV